MGSNVLTQMSRNNELSLVRFSKRLKCTARHSERHAWNGFYFMLSHNVISVFYFAIYKKVEARHLSLPSGCVAREQPQLAKGFTSIINLLNTRRCSIFIQHRWDAQRHSLPSMLHIQGLRALYTINHDTFMTAKGISHKGNLPEIQIKQMMIYFRNMK